MLSSFFAGKRFPFNNLSSSVNNAVVSSAASSTAGSDAEGDEDVFGGSAAGNASPTTSSTMPLRGSSASLLTRSSSGGLYPSSPRKSRPSHSSSSSLKSSSSTKSAYDPAVLGALRNRRLGANEMAPMMTASMSAGGAGSQSARSRLLRPDGVGLGGSLNNRPSPGKQVLETLDEGQSE